MRYKLFVVVVIVALCCRYSNGELAGPPHKNRKEQDGDSVENKSEEFIESTEVNDNGVTALKIVPAPDLSKEQDKRKG